MFADPNLLTCGAASYGELEAIIDMEKKLSWTCGGRMRIVSFITDPRVVDRILRHRESERCKTRDPFEPRPPPGASTKTLQEFGSAGRCPVVQSDPCSAGVCLTAGAITGNPRGKQAWQGLDRSSIAQMQPLSPVQSLPGLFSAAPFPVSSLIPPGFLLPHRIEMPIRQLLPCCCQTIAKHELTRSN